MCRLHASIRPVMWPCPSSQLARPTRRGTCSLRSCRGSLLAPRSYLNYPWNSPNVFGCVPVPCHLRPTLNRTAHESSTFPSIPADPEASRKSPFPKARIPLRLLVKIPEAMRQHEFELFARQVYEGEEVGRITWRLVPLRQPK